MFRIAFWGFLAGIYAVTCARAAHAQDRPSEDEMFGAAPASEAAPSSADAAKPAVTAQSPAPAAGSGSEQTPPAAAQPPATAAARTVDRRDDLVLGATETPMFTEEAAPEDPLTIGGQLYIRSQLTGFDHTPVKDYSLTMPTLIDAFFDARPNDRVRGFALARVSWDPLQPAAALNVTSSSTNMGTAGTSSVSPLFGSPTNSPHVLLDQMWLRFDIAHRVFVTAGRQHVRWGTGRFWTPADFLHLRKRNPLDVFDVRTGTTMVKVHVPIESKAWNFYAYGITEGENGQPSLKTPAGALRAELVFDALELSLGVFGKPNSRAKFEADLSMGLGDFDVYGELAVVDARDTDRVRYSGSQASLNGASELTGGINDGNLTPQQQAQLNALLQEAADQLYPVYRVRGYRPQAVVGLNYSRKYADNDIWTVGLEYFYNGFGYDNSDAYFGLYLPHSTPLENPASSFYLGKHYGALFITFPAPFKLDLHTFTLSTLGNFSDLSFITRLDYAYVLLTHLRLEAYAAVMYGKRGGEFRFVVPNIAGYDPSTFGVRNEPPLVMLGIGLRLAI
jgi:hypothetical protein